MVISRRNFLRRVGGGAALGAVAPSLGGFAHADGCPLSGSRHPGGPIFLDRNENADGPSERVMGAMRDRLARAHLFPRSDPDALGDQLALLHAVRPDQVVLGCGSSDILRMAAAAFLGPGTSLILSAPSFDAIVQYARGAGADVSAVPLTRQHAHDLESMSHRTNAATRLVYLCNPNNPTGSLTPRGDLEAFIRRLPAATHVVVDEAYHHYVGGSSTYASFIDHPLDDRRLIVTRTFSKIHGLAGLRIGYAIAAPQTARRLLSHRVEDGVNVVAAAAALAALDDPEYLRLSADRNTDRREEFFNQANARMLRAIDSHTNFVMLNAGRPAGGVVEHFKHNNILLPPPFVPMRTHVRVSLGTPPDMAEFWRVWDLLPRHGMS